MNEKKIPSNKNNIKQDNIQNKQQKSMSKWLNLKKLLEKKKSLESSVDCLKQKTLNKIASNYCDIYKYKIGMYLFSKESN